MKKTAVFIFTLFIFIFLFSACAPASHLNILAFTDSYNRIADDDKIDFTEYIISNGNYKLLFESEKRCILMTAEQNDSDEIKRIRLSINKSDTDGNAIDPDNAMAYLFSQKAVKVLAAFTQWNREECETTIKKILPSEGKDLLKTGELTLEKDNFRIVYYSNKICCQFTVTNTFLEATETTEKPISRPLFEVTANISPED